MYSHICSKYYIYTKHKTSHPVETLESRKCVSLPTNFLVYEET